MTSVADQNSQTNMQQFKEQTPNTYKWALGASGLVAVATTAALSIVPEVAGYAMAGLLFFILLMFIVVNLEIGTTTIASTNPLAQNAQLQVKVLSWFATVALILGATSIMSSILFGWPLQISIAEDTGSKKFLDSIKRYDLPKSTIERLPNGVWQEKLLRDNSIMYKYTETNFTPQFLTLWDEKRNVTVRIPTRGGMLEWSINDKFKDCDGQYCWGDVNQATMFR
ncbi:hypothetical protein [Bradyrhizobium sp. MOS003]|jgi:hypothetical protein|uniref:hypothetical protein n=1 Tax=Bradyrhizobium sp. MOS003 TaxID=2133946 RepID=UPI000D12B13A|nr:hypothetical protein [Bradyrhizobium sp. MOS003]PSO21756.1 hypothetical protein C7G42_09065 [Bradyrhizobium sp. MOS003]